LVDATPLTTNVMDSLSPMAEHIAKHFNDFQKCFNLCCRFDEP
jgi:hypothetical protein